MSEPANTNANVEPLLQQALDHLSRNEFPPAEALLDQALTASEENCDTLHLYGQVRRLQNRFGEAEDFYRRALVREPERAELHYHLGQVLLLTGRVEDAIASQREAIRLKSNLVYAHLELAAALSRAGDLAGAERSYRDALKLQPNLLSAKQALSGVLIMQHRPKEAESVIRSGLMQAQSEPRWFAALEHNLALALCEQRRYDEALAVFDDVQNMVPDLPRLDYNRASMLQSMGRHDDAEAAYRKALLADPFDLRAHHNLNQLLHYLGRDDFLASYDDALKAQGDSSILSVEKGYLQILTGRHEEALDSYSRALTAAPSDGTARSGLATALTRLGRYDEATREFEHLIHAYPDHVDVLCGFAECLLRAGDAAKALETAQEASRRDPQHQYALAMAATARRQLGETKGPGIDDYESLVQVFDLEPPAGYSDMEAFNRELEAYLATLHLDTREHITNISQTGTKTPGALFGAGHKLVDQLQERIDEAVTAYIERMDSDETHPLFSRRGDGFRYGGSWSTRLGDGGFQAGHVHPRGWISSAYYVALPEATADESDKHGWLKFGEPFFDAGLQDPVRRMVEPKVGRLVLFPSYMWHGTVPFHSQQARTAIAFDVIPA